MSVTSIELRGSQLRGSADTAGRAATVAPQRRARRRAGAAVAMAVAVLFAATSGASAGTVRLHRAMEARSQRYGSESPHMPAMGRQLEDVARDPLFRSPASETQQMVAATAGHLAGSLEVGRSVPHASSTGAPVWTREVATDDGSWLSVHHFVTEDAIACTRRSGGDITVTGLGSIRQQLEGVDVPRSPGDVLALATLALNFQSVVAGRRSAQADSRVPGSLLAMVPQAANNRGSRRYLKHTVVAHGEEASGRSPSDLVAWLEDGTVGLYPLQRGADGAPEVPSMSVPDTRCSQTALRGKGSALTVTGRRGKRAGSACSRLLKGSQRRSDHPRTACGSPTSCEPS